MSDIYQVPCLQCEEIVTLALDGSYTCGSCGYTGGSEVCPDPRGDYVPDPKWKDMLRLTVHVPNVSADKIKLLRALFPEIHAMPISESYSTLCSTGFIDIGVHSRLDAERAIALAAEQGIEVRGVVVEG